MTTHSPFPGPRRAALAVCLALAIAALAVPARADNPPKFKDPEVTAFAQKMSDIFDGLLVAVKAKDNARIKELDDALLALQKNGDAVHAKVSPDEDKAAEAWFEEQTKKLKEAGWTGPHS